MGNPEDELSGKELENHKHNKVVKGIAWYMVIASVLLFAGWVSAFIVSKMDKAWVVIDLPKPFYISTLLIILSSITLYLALRFARQNKQGMLKGFLILTMLFGVSFAYVQYKGWKKLYSQGNVVTGNIFYTYGAYGTDFILLKDEEKIDFNGKDYLVNGIVLSELDVQEIRKFAYQICGNRRREKLDNYMVENYNNSYSILRVQMDSLKEGVVEFKEKKAYVNGEVFLAAAQKDLFRFAFGVYNQTPLFALKGEYGEDFVIRLNNETLEYENNKLFFPAKDLTQSELANINKKVFEGGQEYEIKKGKIYVNGELVDQVNFETYVTLNEGIEVHYKNGKWTRLREELNTAQNNEMRQAGNIASSYIYVFTGMHVLHVLIALILLFVIIKRSFKGYYTEKNQLGIQATSIIWHFLGVLWLSLFLLLQYFH
jgi:cytochrome c oxidase subunit 3